MPHPFLLVIGYARFAVAESEAAALIELCGALSVPCRSDGFGRARDSEEALTFFICSEASSKRLIRIAQRRGIKIHSEETGNQRDGNPYDVGCCGGGIA